MKRSRVSTCLLSIGLVVAHSLAGVGAPATDSGFMRDHEWPPVICFSLADAREFAKVLDRAPQPPSPNVVFRTARERRIRCTTVRASLSFGSVVTTASLENHAYDIVSVELNGRTWFSFAIRADQRS